MVPDLRAGLEKNLGVVKSYFDEVDVRLNIKKSCMFHIGTDGKMFTVNDTAVYEMDGKQISWVEADEVTRYCGKMFGPWGGMTVRNRKR